MPFQQRYSNIVTGGILFVGNTLGLSKLSNAYSPGLLGSIGAFITPDTTQRVGTFPYGTTLDYTKNGSSAVLNMPSGSKVLYAELIWGGLYKSSLSDLSARINDPIELRTPKGVYAVSPDSQTKQDFLIPAGTITVGFYVRSANMTSLVKAAMNGTYTTGKVPSLIEPLEASTAETNHAGWTLAVVFDNSLLPLRDLTLWSGSNLKRIFLLHCFYPIAFIVAVFVPNFLFQFFD